MGIDWHYTIFKLCKTIAGGATSAKKEELVKKFSTTNNY